MGLLRRTLLVGEHTCPWWLAYSFDNSLRRLLHPPGRLLAPYVRPGMTVLDVGCGMGHFSIGMARLVGSGGTVVAADLQPEMLRVLSARAKKRGVADRIRLHRCESDALGLTDAVDFVLMFWMAHEVKDLRRLLDELHALLRDDGQLLLAEPLIHVSAERFRVITDTAAEAGFEADGAPSIRFSRATVFRKGPGEGTP